MLKLFDFWINAINLHKYEFHENNAQSSLFLPLVDHTRVKLSDVDKSQIGAEYINANYIRQPSETDQCDMNSSSTENLSASLCAACTFAQQQKNCQNCQQLNKTCVQCAMKSAIIPLNGNCTNCGKKTEVSVVVFCSFTYGAMCWSIFVLDFRAEIHLRLALNTK